MDNQEYTRRLEFYGLTAAEAEQGATVAAYLLGCLSTGNGAPFNSVRKRSPWDRQGRHPDGTPTEEAFTDPELVRAAMERANPWIGRV